MYTSSSNLVIPLPPTNPPQSSNKLLHFSPITSNYISNKPLFVNSKKINPLVNSQFVPSKLRVSDSITGDGNCNKGFAIEDEEAAAIEAVSKIIEENGGGNVLKKEAYEMAMNSRNYVKLLVDGVNELDELEIGMSGGDGEEGRKSFEEKVYEMGKEKGDKGIVPFLESVVGLSLPSAMHLSRLLLASEQTLSRLVVKVKYVTEMFFSNNSDDYDDDEGRLGEIARRMMMRLSIAVDDESLQQTLSFFEKTQARRGGLDMLGSKDASFYHMIRSFPRLLLLPLKSRVKPIIEFLEDIGVPKRSMRNILLLYPPILFHDIEKDIKPALSKVSAENKDWGGILLKYPWILSTSIQRNHLQIRSLFDTNKVPKSSVDHAIKKWPQLLGCSVDKLTLIVEHFAELGISNRKLGQVIAKSPQILLRKPQDFQQVVYFLKELGIDEETVGRIVGRCPEIFATDIDRILKKKLGFLNRIGVSQGNFPRVIRKYPELFVCDVNKTLLPRMNYLIKIGLSKRDVTFMVCRFSPILGYSINEVLRPKLEFLVNTMKKPTREVVDYPRYFSYSLEKKIEPRYWQLKSRNIECSLKDMLSKNDEEFAAEFMIVETNLDPPVALM